MTEKRRSKHRDDTHAADEPENETLPKRGKAAAEDPVTTSREPPLASAEQPARIDGGDELPKDQRTIQPSDRPLRTEVNLARGPAAERHAEKEG